MSASTEILNLENSTEEVPAAPAKPKLKYPISLAVRSYFERWMLIPAVLVFFAAASIRYFYPVSFIWLIVVPALTAAALISVRAKLNSKRLRQRALAYLDKRQREERYQALIKSARSAVDEFRQEKRLILEKSSRDGQQLTSILSKLDEYENDYIDLLYLYQERARRLKLIRSRDFAASRRALEEDKQRLDKTATGYQRTLAAISQQETLLTRQQEVGRDLESSLDLIKQQARNIRTFITLVSDQVSTMPLGVSWSSDGGQFEQLSDAIQMTKEMLRSVGENY